MSVFTKLVEQDQLGRVTNAFHEMIAASFESHPMPSGKITQAEVKRRFELVASIFVRLRGDEKWGIAMCLDKMPIYLGCELDGVKWTPDKSSIWTPPGVA